MLTLLVANGPEIIDFVKNNCSLTYLVRNGPGMVDFVRNTAGTMNLVENGLVMSYFWWKITEMWSLAMDGPEMTCFLKSSLDNDGLGRNLTLKLVSVVTCDAVFC